MNHRIINAALETSTKSNFKKHPMGCVIFKGSKIITSGANLVFGSGKATLHAEQNAIEQLARKYGKLKYLRKLLNRPETIKDTLNDYSKSQCRKGRCL